MSDATTPPPSAEDDIVEASMPQGEARERALKELDALESGPTEQLHFDPEDATTTQAGEDPIRDFIGRSDGP